MIYSFKNDYSEIASKEVLDRIIEASNEQNVGYGLDKHSLNAKELIKREINNQDCDIHFLIGGTSTNMIVISSILRPFEAVIGVKTAHINVHETGAIESSGHKVLALDSKDGKIDVEAISNVLNLHTDCHMVKPKMVYISNSTEIGTIYKLEELKEIYEFCKKNDLYLFLDGARLGSALCSTDNDITMHDLTLYTDVFYIGATKNGGLIGEAVVINNDKLKPDFDYMIKNRGGLLAKGYINGIIFETLFQDGLYFKNASNANKCAMYLKNELISLGFEMYSDSTTNQIFPIFSNCLIEKIKDDYLFEIIESNSKESVIRLCTSFNTSLRDCEKFIEYLKKKI